MKKIILALLLISILLIGCTEINDSNLDDQNNFENNFVDNNILVDENLPIKDDINNIQKPVEEIDLCKDKKYTHSPIDLEKVVSISPLGSINPPAHTTPTEHTYLHMNSHYESEELFDLIAPGDITIINVTIGKDAMAPDRDEYVINFSLCDSIDGYFDHVKDLSSEIKEKMEKVNCVQWTVNPGNLCFKEINYEVSAGDVIGKVGHVQGNFDFGLIDTRQKEELINPNRFGEGTKAEYKVCPYDYYDAEMKEKFYALFENNGDPPCGKVVQDKIGTLQGNWFFEDASWTKPSDWDKQLSLIYEHSDPNLQMISIGGVFTDAGKWQITSEESGTKNRKFEEVKVDGKIYCYEGIDPYLARDPAKASQAKHSGKILIQLVNDLELLIEHQEGNCLANETFVSPTTYNR